MPDSKITNAKIELAQGRKNIHLKYGEYGNVDLNAVHATCGDSFFVVMTLQRGEQPEVKEEGTGLDAKVTVDRQTISLDGEKIILDN